MSLTKLIPNPIQRLPDAPSAASSSTTSSSTSLTPAFQSTAPPYGHRRNWMPRRDEDFGDGGAFPEIRIVQYPLGMGRPKQAGDSGSNALPLTLDAEGNVRYDALVKMGQRKDKIVHSQFKDLLPKEIDESDPSFQRPDDEEVKELTDKTRDALQRLIESKVAASKPVRSAEKSEPAQFIRYTPSEQGSAYNSGASQRIVRMVEAQKDPMEPPKFHISKKVPRGPPSPPPTVMHSPPRKVSTKEQSEWKIPPSVSNWKNPKGYTIPLDKRVAADGRGLQTVHLNEKFVMLAEALSTAEAKSREAVAMRAKVDSQIQQRERERREEELKRIAQQARDHRAGIRETGGDKEARERDEIRRERAGDRQHQRRRGQADGKSTTVDRDISEQIALGQPAVRRNDPEAEFDTRLFNREAGLSSGFQAGEDETYNVYDKPWRPESAAHIYRPTKQSDQDLYGEDLDKLANTRRFVPDRHFDGASRSGVHRDGPVEFEKKTDLEEEDPFGLTDLFEKVKQPAESGRSHGSKRQADGSGGGSGRKRDRRD